jgi:membrane protease YdiL (CAAX protease family)
MKLDFLRNLGPGTQLMMLMLIAFFTLFLMQLTAFLVVRPIWGINIFESMDELVLLKDQQSVNINKVMQVFSHIGMFLLPAMIFANLFKDPDKNFFVYRKKQDYSVWIIAGIFFIIAFPFINLLHLANLQIPFSETLAADDEKSTLLLTKLLGGEGALILLVNIFVYAVIPAIGEELLFRGVILRQTALATKNVHVAVWVSAAVFSFIHLESSVFIPRFLMGAALGYMFVWSGNIWLGVLAHLVNNIFSIVIINSVLNNRLDAYYDTLGVHKEDLAILILSILAVAVSLFYLNKKKNNSYRLFMIEQELRRKTFVEGEDEFE